MTVRPLPSSTPAAQGVDASGVLAFLGALDAAPDIEPHSLMILRHGRLVASGWWAPYTAERPHLLYSISKSFTAAAAGIAAAEGLIRLDDPVISYFPEFEADITDPRSRAMLVRHVASMASGHESDTLFAARELDRENLVRGFLLIPPARDPGTVFAYNQPATFTLSALVQKASGQSLTEYLRPRLLDPLGIGDVGWLRDRSGRELGFSGLHATTDAVARLGELYLRGGVWEGERLLPEWWVAEATRAQIETAGGMPGEDWQRGYGFKFWMSRHGYRGDGAFGQFCLVLPEQDAVIATTGDTWNMQAVLDLVWEHLLPAFRPAPLTGGEAADAALAARLAGLALSPAAGKPAPPERAQAWSAAAFTPDGGVCAQLPKLTAIDLAPGADGWTLTLTEDGHPLRVRLGEDGWTVAEEPVPTAVSGGWTDPDTLVVDVAFLETPHHLDVRCSLKDRTFKASWRTEPLHGLPLRAMRAPRASA
ncbi:class A beta-lactamase-related serine hydrolase [Streptomyces cyaneochromogenes]|uniref:Class A beta-lactamase-related serine hydrolase n=1 Tax=Streptomyces cyaneochromogenes TaxID=2496836 RepID=A0A3S9MKB1_9ACTN|nr:serine hydrolase domain-containing protein [Streptomyces cyaneochromogenes]AZQ39629.1 class A beta-lactamase-related serine hydrolase [Streptomyces cyaneochromogenes]